MTPGPQTPGRSRLRIKPANPAYTDAVLAALAKIKSNAEGRVVFRRLRDAGSVVTIEPPDPPTDPPNAWTRWRDPPGRIEKELVIAFNPADWPARPGSLPCDAILFGRLADAAALAAGAPVHDQAADPDSTEIAAYLRQRARERAGARSK
jgi:hypothetical protein